jgi:hypothetical protein
METKQQIHSYYQENVGTKSLEQHLRSSSIWSGLVPVAEAVLGSPFPFLVVKRKRGKGFEL